MNGCYMDLVFFLIHAEIRKYMAKLPLQALVQTGYFATTIDFTRVPVHYD